MRGRNMVQNERPYTRGYISRSEWECWGTHTSHGFSYDSFGVGRFPSWPMATTGSTTTNHSHSLLQGSTSDLSKHPTSITTIFTMLMPDSVPFFRDDRRGYLHPNKHYCTLPLSVSLLRDIVLPSAVRLRGNLCHMRLRPVRIYCGNG